MCSCLRNFPRATAPTLGGAIADARRLADRRVAAAAPARTGRAARAESADRDYRAGNLRQFATKPVPFALVFLLLSGWILFPQGAGAWGLLILSIIVLPSLLAIFTEFLRKPKDLPFLPASEKMSGRLWPVRRARRF